MTTSTNLEITHIQTSQGQKEVTANAAFNILDGAVAGEYALSMPADADYDFSTVTPPGRVEALSALAINITSAVTLTATRTVTFPENNKLYLIKNATTGNQSLLIEQDVIADSFTLGPSERALVYASPDGWVRLIPRLPAVTHPQFGTGIDGALSVAGTTTLTRDMMYSTVSVSATGVLETKNFRVYASSYVIIASGGIIHCDGAAGAAGGGAGAALAQGSLSVAAHAAGGAGGLAGGTIGGAITGSGLGNPGGGATNGGGAGGAGSGGAGGGSGQYTPITAVQGNPLDMWCALNGITYSGTPLACGGGGGGGGGDGAVNGGGGGAPGGYVSIIAPMFINNGVIRALGGNGGSPASGNTGGGGGGQGGIVVLCYYTYQGSGSTSAAGGTGGTKQGTGVNGSNGAAGAVRTYAI